MLTPVRVALRVSVVVLLCLAPCSTRRISAQDRPDGFIPSQDKGYLLVNVQLPDAASLDARRHVMRQLDETRASCARR